MKKKKKEKNKTMRCQKNVIRMDRFDKNFSNILTLQMKASKCIYNQGIYCQRIWYSRAHLKILEYYSNNLETYLTDFSTQDKVALFWQSFISKNFSGINKLMLYVRSLEKDTFNDLIKMAKDKFKKK